MSSQWNGWQILALALRSRLGVGPKQARGGTEAGSGWESGKAGPLGDGSRLLLGSRGGALGIKTSELEIGNWDWLLS